MENNSLREAGYLEGSKAAYRALLLYCLRALDYDDPLAQAGRYLAERADAIAALRTLCQSHGDNDWPDNLYLRDILEKHLNLEEEDPE